MGSGSHKVEPINADNADMHSEIVALFGAIESASSSVGELQKTAARLLKGLDGAPQAEKDAAVAAGARCISIDDAGRAGLAAMICGALVERGADPSPLEQPLVARLEAAMQKLAAEPEPAAEEASLPAEPVTTPVKPVKRVGLLRSLFRMLLAGYRMRKAMKRLNEEYARIPVSASQSEVRALAPAAVAMFSVRPALRLRHPELARLAEATADREPMCGCLQSVLTVLDDEPVLVIEPSTGIGILGRISGVDVNFTLAMLLMHCFPSQDGEVRSRLSPAAAKVVEGGPQQTGESVAGAWNLYNWQALKPDQTLPAGQQDSQHWIWNEGRPADIAVFEGRRVILLGPPAYRRTWPAGRTFAAMKPSLRTEKVLASEEVQGWLERIAAAPRPA